jgi:hypothetical protein
MNTAKTRARPHHLSDPVTCSCHQGRFDPGNTDAGRCIFSGCVSRERHWHGGFSGGYTDPADPDGAPIPFTAEPAPGVRDYNGAILDNPNPGVYEEWQPRLFLVQVEDEQGFVFSVTVTAIGKFDASNQVRLDYPNASVLWTELA